MNNHKVKNNSILLLIAFCSLVYLVWPFIGLRYTNHDDIFLHLTSYVFSDDYFGFARYAAYAHSRLQAFINMPIILWINSIESTKMYDVLNIGVFIVLCVSCTNMLAQLTSLRDALVISIAIALLYPLHYYFTFPQSYPVMAAWPLACFFVSIALYDAQIHSPSKLKLYGSVAFFLSSLWGPEYNFILHPVMLVFFAICKKNGVGYQTLFKSLLPYACGWLLCFSAYWLFSFVARQEAMDSVGRMSLNFSLINWIKTFLILQEKSFLPIALLRGINFSDASLHGGPVIPSVITYASIFQSVSEASSLFLVFFISSVIFGYLFSIQKISTNSFFRMVTFLICFITIPCIVVSASTHYQEIVLKGYLQGHLITFYSQVGIAGVVFVSSCFMINGISLLWLRRFVILSFTIVFATFCTLTLVYNNVNRQAMMLNAQKWVACKLLSDHINSTRLDLKERVIAAPAFWSASGVSSIPNESPFSGKNYWSEYTELVLKNPLKVSKVSKDNDVDANYVLRTEDGPVVILQEFDHLTNTNRITLISTNVLEGELISAAHSNVLRKISANEWTCTDRCVFTLDSKDKVFFEPARVIEANLMSQFMSKRYHN